MSGLIGTTGATTTLVSFLGSLERVDWRLNKMNFRQLGEIFADGINAIAPASFETEWWPRGPGMLGADGALLEAAWWGEFDPAAGSTTRFLFIGVTRDALGTPVPTVVVKVFLTATDALIESTTSDPSGNFTLGTHLYPNTHYIITHKTGSPDLDGISVNTLTGV